MTAPEHPVETVDHKRAAEDVLRKFGYARVRPDQRESGLAPTFWVQEAGVPRRTWPVFVESASAEWLGRWNTRPKSGKMREDRAILVVHSDRAADEAWDRISLGKHSPIDSELAILVVPVPVEGDVAPHWHPRVVGRSEVLRIATGVVVGMFQRAQESEGIAQIDFEEMLALLRTRFGIDVHRSLDVRSDEDALFLIYQMAMRDAYAPGDPGANLHMLVLKPTGPAAHLPWFAA